ncbi:MAG: hypothetical protein RLZZ464_1958 [Pseudomonadota bacterium]|jgi:1-acyl-sn-glycerol-3-phosphate acyltransferase
MTHPVTFKGSRLARWILKAFGWTLNFEGFPTLQGVAIVYPHTSNWDFPVGILAKWALGIPANFWGKDSLFKFPIMGAWMRWVGGVPIDRSSPKGVVGEMVQVFEQHQREERLLWLALAPEGTRSLTPGWRSGFYQVAKGAEVPLALVKLDWGTRTLSLVDFYNLTGDVEADYAHMAQVFEGVRGYNADQASPVAPWSPVARTTASPSATATVADGAQHTIHS